MLATWKACLVIALTVATLLLSTCSQASKPAGADESAAKAAEPASASEPVTAKTAYWEMYKSAYKWAPDLVLLRMDPKEIPGFKNEGGKAALWEGTFASPTRHEYRIFSYAVAAHSPDIYRGVMVGDGIQWAGVSREVMPVPISAVNADSDAAFTTATGDAAAWLKKNPGKQLTSFQLGNGYAFSAPVWYFMWGDKKSGYVVYVNATTGKVVKK